MTEYAVFDVETTGLAADRHDRIVEIAIVRVTGLGEVLDSFSTLLYPERDTGPSEIHGITDDLVEDAPTFADIAGEISDRLEGAVLTGHNVSFDLRFLAAELARAGAPLPEQVDSLCTIRIAKHAGMPVPRTLGACCQRAGIRLDDAHSALADATATAKLLLACGAAGVDLGAHVRAFRPRPAGTRWPRPSGRALARPRHQVLAELRMALDGSPA